MGEMEKELNQELQNIFAAREARREALAAKPFPEKIRILVKMQEMVAPIERKKGRAVRIWKLEGS